MNLTSTITPKSDQLNADDLLTGPRTITITAVESGSAEQPVTIRFEGDNGRPYKPSKGMRRVLVAMWGGDGSAYIGKRLTLYCDKSVTFGPDTTGGIRISHADIPEAVEIALTVKRGKRKPFRVEPLPAIQAAEPIDVQALVDVGETKARGGKESFRAWWNTLTTAAKSALKPKIDEWKQMADDADSRAAA